MLLSADRIGLSQALFFLVTGAFAITAHPSPRRIEAEFIFAYMRTVRLADVAQTGVIPSVNNGHIKGLQIPKLNEEQQRALLDRGRVSERALNGLRRSMNSVAELRSTILNEIFGGN